MSIGMHWEKKEGGGGHRFLAVCTQEGGGGYIQVRTECNMGGGGGGSRNWEKCVCN